MSYALVISMTLLAAFASYFLKKSTQGNSIISIITNKFLYIGGTLYVMSSLINVWVLRFLPYSIVVPMGGICYIWTILISWKFLNEKINLKKILGVILIICGVVFITL